jgi:hypothetical protein
MKIIPIILLSLVMTEVYSQDEMHRVNRRFATVFKYVPTQVAVGEFNLAIEQQVAKRSSLELDFGLTAAEIDIFNAGLNEHRLGTIDFQFQKKVYSGETLPRIGFMGALGFRYYPIPSDRNLHRLYISPIVKFKQYAYQFEPMAEQNGDIVFDNIDGTDARLNLSFNFGYQLHISSFIMDFFLGAGIGYRKYDEHVAVEDWATGVSDYYYVSSVKEMFIPIGQLGVKVGVLWEGSEF